MLRRGAVDVRVFKEEGQYGALRQLVKVHLGAVQDTVRAQNRLKGIFRSRGVPVAGKSVYGLEGRDEWLAKLPRKSRTGAELLYAQYDASCEQRNMAERELVVESRRHPICRVLETCPGLGTVRVARLVAMVVTPHRFRRRSQLWAYCGLAIVMRSSSDWMQAPDGQWVKTDLQRTRGLNKNPGPHPEVGLQGRGDDGNQRRETALAEGYRRQLDAGTKPNLARLTLARRIAATVLAMWKHEEVYDPDRSARSTA